MPLLGATGKPKPPARAPLAKRARIAIPGVAIGASTTVAPVDMVAQQALDAEVLREVAGGPYEMSTECLSISTLVPII